MSQDVDTGVPHRWFSAALPMGDLYGVSKAIAQERRNPRQPRLRRTLGTPISKA